MNKTGCPACGSEDLQLGKIRGLNAHFIPTGMKFFQLSLGASINAATCMACGAITLWTDPDEVRALISKPKS
jgi:hypothetical protein